MEAAKHGIARRAFAEGPVFCAQDGYCFLLPAREDKRAFFGTIEQIRVISDARQGRTPSLQSNATLMDLMGRTDPRSPVIGFAPGRDIGALDWD